MTVQTFTPAAVVAGIPDGAAMLAAWAQTATSAASLVGPLVETPFVPEHFRAKIDPRATDEEKAHARQVAIASATAAVLYGAEIGLSPMQALQGVLVIKGKVGMYAATMVALVQAAGHEVWTEDSSDARVIVCGRRAGTQAIERQVWDIDRARRAGYLSNEKYKTDPQAMLWARAASVVCRRIAQDVLKGITASTEEIVDEDARTAPRAATRTVSRAPARPEPPAGGPAPAAAQPAERTTAGRQDAPVVHPDRPPLPGEDDGAEHLAGPFGSTMTVPTQAIGEAAWRRINSRFVELEVIGNGQSAARLAVISHLIGRKVTRGGELTATEGQLVLDNLAGDAGYTVLAEVFPVERVETDFAESVPGTTPADAPRVLGDADPNDDGDYDPTVQPGWDQQGGQG